jgi:transcriptional regulator with XRE-family HTH domain
MARTQLTTKEERNQQRSGFYAALDEGSMSLRDAVKRMRKMAGMTQQQFADNRGVSVRVIMEIEGGRGNPTVETLNKIGEIFGVEVAFVRKQRGGLAQKVKSST